VRSNIFYPADSADGWVVYEGDGRMVVDKIALADNEEVYYTVFTYDEKGNYSSGAVTALGRNGQILFPDSKDNGIDLKFKNLEFYQDGEKLIPKGGGIYEINGGQHMTIAIPYEILPEHLKTILVTLEKTGTNQVFSFLLRINQEKTAYTARLAPLGVAGEFMVRVSVFDYATAQVGYTEGNLLSKISSYRDDIEDPLSTPSRIALLKFFSQNYIIFFSILLILLFFLSIRLLRVRE
jgi:hypothetical protein